MTRILVVAKPVTWSEMPFTGSQY